MGKRILIGKVGELAPGKMKVVDAEGMSILVAHTDAGVCAVKNSCPHMYLPLGNGKLEGNTLTCPWHQSSYNVCTGKNLDWVRGIIGVPLPSWSRKVVALGKQPQPLRTYEVVEDDGKLYIEV